MHNLVLLSLVLVLKGLSADGAAGGRSRMIVPPVDIPQIDRLEGPVASSVAGKGVADGVRLLVPDQILFPGKSLVALVAGMLRTARIVNQPMVLEIGGGLEGGAAFVAGKRMPDRFVDRLFVLFLSFDGDEFPRTIPAGEFLFLMRQLVEAPAIATDERPTWALFAFVLGLFSVARQVQLQKKTAEELARAMRARSILFFRRFSVWVPLGNRKRGEEEIL